MFLTILQISQKTPVPESLLSKAVAQRCPVKNVFLEISQNSQTLTQVFFL